MIKKLTSRAISAGAKLAGKTKALAKGVRSGVSSAWKQHRERVNSDPDYASALGAAGTAVAKLFTKDRAYLAVVTAFAGLYVAIHHATNKNTWRPTQDPWGSSQSRWDPDDRWDDGVDWR